MLKNGDTISVDTPIWRKKQKISEKDLSYNISNEAMLVETHVSMFEYDGLPETVNPFFLELYLQTQGCVVWTDAPGVGLVTIEGTTADDLDVYGIGQNVIAVTRNGKEYRLKQGDNCVVGYNNRSMSPCYDIFVDAQTLSDIQTSIDFLIFWTRLSPLIRVTDEKLKDQVITAFKNIRRGIPATVLSKKQLDEFGLSDDIKKEDLTQPDFADKIQYTAKLYDDVLRWHFTRYGHATNGNSKAAQQTVDEVDSTASQSMILPLSMLWARREMIEKVNALFGTSITVELSGAWKAEVTAYENQSGEQNIDDSADASAPDSVSDETGALPDSDNQEQPDKPAPEDPETECAPADVIGAIEEAAETIADAIREGGSDNETV